MGLNRRAGICDTGLDLTVSYKDAAVQLDISKSRS